MTAPLSERARAQARTLPGFRHAQRWHRWQNDLRLRVRRRAGYRGVVLILFGLLYIFIGLSIIGANDYADELVHTHLPTWFRVLLWAIPGVTAVAVATDHKWQVFGFALLFIPPSERAISYCVAALTVPTLTRLPGVLIYLLILVTVAMLASWPEPTEVEHLVLDQDDGDLDRQDDGKYFDGAGDLHDAKDADE